MNSAVTADDQFIDEPDYGTFEQVLTHALRRVLLPAATSQANAANRAFSAGIPSSYVYKGSNGTTEKVSTFASGAGVDAQVLSAKLYAARLALLRGGEWFRNSGLSIGAASSSDIDVKHGDLCATDEDCGAFYNCVEKNINITKSQNYGGIVVRECVDNRLHYPLIAASDDFLVFSPFAFDNVSVITSDVMHPVGFSADRADVDTLILPSQMVYPRNSSRAGESEESPVSGLYWNAAELGGTAPAGTLSSRKPLSALWPDAAVRFIGYTGSASNQSDEFLYAPRAVPHVQRSSIDETLTFPKVSALEAQAYCKARGSRLASSGLHHNNKVRWLVRATNNEHRRKFFGGTHNPGGTFAIFIGLFHHTCFRGIVHASATHTA
jgi:hypothetical protein